MANTRILEPFTSNFSNLSQILFSNNTSVHLTLDKNNLFNNIYIFYMNKKYIDLNPS